jgi:hypothetical protein
MDPSPDYDASDKIEFGVDWFYPPPVYPPV